MLSPRRCARSQGVPVVGDQPRTACGSNAGEARHVDRRRAMRCRNCSSVPAGPGRDVHPGARWRTHDARRCGAASCSPLSADCGGDNRDTDRRIAASRPSVPLTPPGRSAARRTPVPSMRTFSSGQASTGSMRVSANASLVTCAERCGLSAPATPRRPRRRRSRCGDDLRIRRAASPRLCRLTPALPGRAWRPDDPNRCAATRAPSAHFARSRVRAPSPPPRSGRRC